MNFRFYYSALSYSALLIGAAGPMPEANAAESMYSLGYRLEYSDNLRLAESNKQSGLISIPTFAYDLQHRSVNWDADLLADLRYEDYVDNTFGDRWTGVADGTLTWYIVPQRFTWVTTDYFRQVVISTTQPNNPTNQQIVNTFSTGPDVQFRLNPVTDIAAEYRFTDIYEELTNNDSNRNNVAIRLRHRRTPLKTVSLNYEFSDVDFDDSQNIDFKRHDYFLGYESKGARTVLNIDLGASRFNRTGARDLDGRLFRANTTYRLSRLSSAALTLQDLMLETGYVRATSGILADIASTAGNFATTAIYRERMANLSYSNQGRVLTLSTSIYGLRREYIDNLNLNRRLVGTSLQVDFDMSATTRMTLQGYFQDINYTSLGRIDKDSFLSLRYQQRLSSTLYISAEFRRLTRDSSIPGASYVENRLAASIRYKK